MLLNEFASLDDCDKVELHDDTHTDMKLIPPLENGIEAGTIETTNETEQPGRNKFLELFATRGGAFDCGHCLVHIYTLYTTSTQSRKHIRYSTTTDGHQEELLLILSCS